MKKSIFATFLWILVLISSCIDGKKEVSIRPSDALKTQQNLNVDTMGEIVSRIKQQSRLYTTECQIHKVVLFSDDARIGGTLIDIPLPGDRKVAIPIDVTLKAYVDFSTFTSRNVVCADSLCIINLPDPQIVVTSSRVDHQGTRQYVSVTRSKFSDNEISHLATQGEDTIVSHLNSYGIINQARESCARTLVPILTAMGYNESNIVIRFNRSFDDADIRKITSMQK